MAGLNSQTDDRLLMIAAGVVVAMGLAWLLVEAPWSQSETTAIDEVDLAIGSAAAATPALAPVPALAVAVPDQATGGGSDPLRMAQMALEAGMLTEPPEYSAWTLFGRVASSDPSDAAARAGLETVAEALAARGRAALEQGRYDAATGIVETIRARLPDHREAAALAEAIAIALSPPEPEPAPPPPAAAKADPTDRIADLHAAFRDAMARNAVLQPAGSSAIDVVGAMLALAADHEITENDRSMLVTELLDRSAQSIEALDAEAARTWIDSARPLVRDGDPLQQAEARLTAYLIEAESQKIVSAADLQIVSNVVPVYPRVPQERGIEGWVELEFVVDPAGATEDITVIDASHSSYFRDEAVTAVSQWRFEPVRFEDQPISKRVVTRVRFELD